MRLLIDRKLLLRTTKSIIHTNIKRTHLCLQEEFDHGIRQSIGKRFDISEFLQHRSIERAIDLLERDLTRIVHVDQRAMP